MSFKFRVNNNYIPNTQDPVTKNRIESALTWVVSLFGGQLANKTKTNKPVSLSHKEIVAAVGNCNDKRRPLAIQLALTLLIPASTHHTAGKPKTYFINWHAYDYWESICSTTPISYGEYKKLIPPPDKPSLAKIEYERQQKELTRLMDIATRVPTQPKSTTEILQANQMGTEQQLKSGEVLSFSHISALPQRVHQIYARIIDKLDDKFHKEMTSLRFVMGDARSNRFYHDIHKENKEFKLYMFCRIGLKHHYDIEQSIVNMIVQQAINNGLQEPCSLLRSILMDKSKARNLIASNACLPLDKTKTFINALIYETHPRYTRECMYKQTLQITASHFKDIFDNPIIQQLQKEIDQCWEVLMPLASVFLAGDFPLTDRGNKSKDKRRIKAAYYFKLERRVVDIVKREVEQTDNRWFREHDGWYTKTELDIHKILSLITAETGLLLTIHHHITDGDYYYEFQ